ncbi:MAG: hypothetical protein JOZ27_05690 [Caulobacteraceae bacterium]|nr:hypothetical protein [Caulobacteraceae bacterium]
MPARKSGLDLRQSDIPIVLGMVARGDRKQDIAAWFGVNPARIQEAIRGDYGTPPMAQQADLPFTGPPGVKGRRVRAAIDEALVAPDFAAAKAILSAAAQQYDTHEP